MAWWHVCSDMINSFFERMEIYILYLFICGCFLLCGSLLTYPTSDLLFVMRIYSRRKDILVYKFRMLVFRVMECLSHLDCDLVFLIPLVTSKHNAWQKVWCLRHMSCYVSIQVKYVHSVVKEKIHVKYSQAIYFISESSDLPSEKNMELDLVSNIIFEIVSKY